MEVFLCFCILAFLTLLKSEDIKHLRGKPVKLWILDISGLMMQGFVVPLVQVSTLYTAYLYVAPSFKGILELPTLGGFLLNFVLVDYFYYWNHRLFHHKNFWPIHKIHHTSENMDIFVTSRNTLWTPFFIVYIWANSLLIFLLKHPEAYIFSMTLSACLDIWHHSKFSFRPDGLLQKSFSTIFITPVNHAWHHSQTKPNFNFGANLNIWDRLHGTYYKHKLFPFKVGIATRLTFSKQLLFPFESKTLKSK